MPSYGLSGTKGAAVVASPKINTVYSVQVSYNGACAKGATMQVNVVPSPTVLASADTTYHLDEVMLINAVGTGSLTWIQGEGIVCSDCPETRVYATHNGCYIVQAQDDNGCLATDNVCIEVLDDFTVYLPNSFTPNKDGINDVFLVYGESISQVKMSIYDRWGAKVFYSEDVFKGWDGSFKGVDCKQDIYTYVVSYYGLNRKMYTRTGHVNLLR
jgi:gliding motility-associated-like protein